MFLFQDKTNYRLVQQIFEVLMYSSWSEDFFRDMELYLHNTDVVSDQLEKT